jgi:D-glycero-alpha-D-manno-heptose-7-phosphate kinase
MIIVKSPFRISYFGGGTDFPIWFENNDGGRVISTTINKYCYVFLRVLPPFFSFNYRLRYYETELANNIKDIKHPSIKCILEEYYKKKGGLEIIHWADIPALSGLGASSSFSCSLIKGIFELNNKKISKQQLAQKSVYIEKNLLGEAGGLQDQYAISHGGFNEIIFNKKKITVQKLKISEDKKKLLEDFTTIFFTGISRKANDIENKKINLFFKKKNYYEEILNICKEAKNIFSNNDKKYFISEIAELLNLSWSLKKNLSSEVSSHFIDQIYSGGMKNGAIAGKILGAGGGGFILFLSKDKFEKKKLIKYLNKLKYVNIKFENLGTRIINKDIHEYI